MCVLQAPGEDLLFPELQGYLDLLGAFDFNHLKNTIPSHYIT